MDLSLRKISTCLLVCMLIFGGCKLNDDDDSSNQQLTTDQAIIEKFLDDNNLVAEKTDAGFYLNPIVSNPGGKVIESDEIVSLYYTLSLLDGATIHSVQAPEQPLQILFGRGLIIPQSIEWALTEMKVGEKYEFYMPSGFSYANYSYDNLIPSFAIFKVEVEVLRADNLDSQKELERQRILTYMDEQGLVGSVEKEDGLFYVQQQAGAGDPPINLQTVTVDYHGRFLDGTKFDSSIDRNEPFSFPIGQGAVIAGWDQGFKDLLKGEKGVLLIPSHLAYGSNFYVAPPEITSDLISQGIISSRFSVGIPPYSTLSFEVEVLEIKN